MTVPQCYLECQWTDLPESNGRFDFTLINFGGEPLSGFTLTYTSLTRAADLDGAENATLVSRFANNHQVRPPEGFVLQPGGRWSFAVTALTRKAVHRTDGVSTAFLVFADGSAQDVASGDLMLNGAVAGLPPLLVPEGRMETPLALTPWPNGVAVEDFAAAPVALYADAGDDRLAAALHEVGALAQRLFPNAITPFAFGLVAGGRLLSAAADAGLEAEAYRLDFTPENITLSHGGAAGLFYGLVTLAQMLHGAHDAPERFSFPVSGTIADAPRYGWRGCHLDVSRQVYPLADVRRFIDILAWNKLNMFHWHLTDDEGWRLEIKAIPELTDAGARQGPGAVMPAQLGTGAQGSGGYYTQDEVRELVAAAARLHVQIMPEFDIPGHCTAVLMALPHLRDKEEEADSYRSVQGYPNNALNPAMEESYEFLETVLTEAAALFPFEYIHVGGDEVADGSWMRSPKAQALMNEVGLSGTAELQAYFLSRSKTILERLGKKMAGWDEVSHGGGVAGSLLMAWQTPEVGIALAEQGYDVVMCPGQAYYLDMVQADDWLEPGTSWAGTVPPEHSYTYEAAGDFPAALRDRLKGVQACIWSEHLTSRARFNHMVFPRLSAVAEAAWTEPARKDWLRFCAVSRVLPQL